MLKACLIVPAVALLLGGAAAAQPMPLPPSASETPPAPEKPRAKPKAARKRAPEAAQVGTPVERPRQSTATPLRPFDRRDIAEPESERRLQPSLTPSGGIGMGGRF